MERGVSDQRRDFVEAEVVVWDKSRKEVMMETKMKMMVVGRYGEEQEQCCF